MNHLRWRETNLVGSRVQAAAKSEILCRLRFSSDIPSINSDCRGAEKLEFACHLFVSNEHFIHFRRDAFGKPRHLLPALLLRDETGSPPHTRLRLSLFALLAWVVPQNRAMRVSFAQLSVATAECQPQFVLQFVKIAELPLYVG